MNVFSSKKMFIMYGLCICLQAECAEDSLQVLGAGGIPDDLQDLELGESGALTPDALMPFISRNPYVTEAERRLNIEQVLARVQTRSGTGSAYLQDLQDLVGHQRKTKSIGLPITVTNDQLKPAVHWLAAKVLKKDAEVMGRKIDRQKMITGVTNVGSWLLATGFAALIAYLGSLYR